MKRIVGGMNNPWNAFQSAFAEQPFDTYAMTKCQVAMFYHTMKDHLVRHVDALTARPTGSLWDYVPEPRLHVAQPLINDARVGVGQPEFATEACFVCNVFGPCPCTQAVNTGVVDPEEDTMKANEDRGNAEAALRCLGCGRFMHRDDVYGCMDCPATPFHLECLEPHYEQAHPRPQQAFEGTSNQHSKRERRCTICGEYANVPFYNCNFCDASPSYHHGRCCYWSPRRKKEKVNEEEILQYESDEARLQWVDQMTNISKSAMPLGRKIASIVVALVSVGLAVGPFRSPDAADVPVSLLQ